MLDEHSELLEGRDRKEKKKLFKAIHQGDFDGFQPASRFFVLLLENCFLKQPS